MSRSAVELLRNQYRQAAEWYTGTVADVTEDAQRYEPEGEKISPIAGQMGHVVTGLDFFLLNMVGGKPPLLTSEFADRQVISEPPPMGGDWVEWGTRVKLDNSALQEYTQAVFDAIDEMLADMEDSDLQREVDFGEMGSQSAEWAFTIMLLNTFSHTGEIAVIKGLQGLKGYPM